ncbi:hypothetical protein O181_011884 [Austropuccinia psidii MF-1]|uniref:Uncharacterized protein n=1 Tax=Austropuccinia psidii MF-1 TaxID=1389203 RepID=A0A9Q3BTM0_9BASI|nr:hypothetical protein [Austropuccinia psidii MF-1]
MLALRNTNHPAFLLQNFLGHSFGLLALICSYGDYIDSYFSTEEVCFGSFVPIFLTFILRSALICFMLTFLGQAIGLSAVCIQLLLPNIE